MTPEVSIKLENRREALNSLHRLIREMEPKIIGALKEDLNKSLFEAVAGELEALAAEIKFSLRKLNSWVKPIKVGKPCLSISHWGSKNYIRPEAFGRCLIMGPWNYPFYLMLTPLVSALAAGNRCVLKPSEMAPASSRLIAEMINNNFDSELVQVVEGDVGVAQKLLDQVWDLIFFTGSPRVGRYVMEKAARNLSPVILELGGKSPCILDETAALGRSLKRILWAKFFCAGQTCVAPDYLMITEKAWAQSLELIPSLMDQLFPADFVRTEFAHIVNDKHFARLERLIENENVFLSLERRAQDRLFGPCIIVEPSLQSPVMQEEIFGPILPVLKVESVNRAIAIVRSKPKALALYHFSKNKEWMNRVEENCSAGGMMFNDALLYLTNYHLPFGGVGMSGMGTYHGFYGFKAFSHWKAVEKKGFFPDSRLRYWPYPDLAKRSFVRRFL
ncbi:MAG: aldehyde dehydrogenase family protein [Deltaproteobacteria bacterium CG11_big_fil_rev_8_21_14_0_20_45_16]|nr:MAG: aldehyde dehydrogenase family protein [Deltaproteobacteria bacterium CG11_big_fil_rev_8_21_14_0_20_45_16]